MVTRPPPAALVRLARGERWAGAVLAVSALVAVAVGPWVVLRATAQLAAWVVVVAGAGVVVGRAAALDLSAGATTLAGAVGGAVAVGVTGLAPAASPLLAMAAGSAVGALAGVVIARTGGGRAVVPTVLLTIAAVGLVVAADGLGGAAGYHAVPFLAGGDRVDGLVAVAAAVLVTTALGAWQRTRVASRLAVAVRAPVAAAATGRPVLGDAALGAALGGAVTGLGGALLAHLGGAVSPTGHGLGLVAAVVVAVLVGGRPPLGPWLGAALVWGPGLLWPVAAGRLPVALTTLPLALGALALTGRGLLPARPPGPPRRVGGDAPAASPAGDHLTAGDSPRRGDRPPVLSAALPGGRTLAVHAGRVVALVGPNGSGKSTLLAQLGGQLPDELGTCLAGRPAPRGASARRRAGLARTFQRLPDVDPADLRRVVEPESWPGAAALETVLDAGGRGHDRAVGAGVGPAWQAHLETALATPARILLLDEPMPDAPAELVAALVRALATAGLAIVLVDHRDDVTAVADQQLALPLPGAVRLPGREPAAPASTTRVATTTPTAADAPTRSGSDGGAGLTLTVTHADRTHTARAEPGAHAVLALPPATATPVAAVLSASDHRRLPGSPVVRVARADRVGLTVAVGTRGPRRWTTDWAARQGVAVVTDVVAADVPVVDHLAGGRDRARALLATAPLPATVADLPAGVLSGGERRLLGWLRAVAMAPAAVVVTTTEAGLDPAATAWTRGQLARWRDEGVTTVVVQADRGDDHPPSDTADGHDLDDHPDSERSTT